MWSYCASPAFGNRPRTRGVFKMYFFFSLLIFFFFFTIQKASFFLFSFLTLCLCLQHFLSDFLFLSKNSMLDPVVDTFSTHGTNVDPAKMFFCFRQPSKDFRSHSMNPLKSAWAHATCRFWCFPNLLGIKANNSITGNLGQFSFIRGYNCRKAYDGVSNAGSF